MKIKFTESFTNAVGNIFEWYSYSLFMPFFPILLKTFFPEFSNNVDHQTMIGFVAIGVGLFVRPLGSIVFGPIGDVWGRRTAIAVSILLMAVPTFLLSFLPSYAKIGLLAPIILVLVRTLQGISMGGEYTATMVHLVEQAPNHKRGFYGSWTDAGNQLGALLGGQALIVLYFFFNEKEIYDFAWRIPFFLVALLIPFGFSVKSEEKKKNKNIDTPLKVLLREHMKEALSTIAITAFSAFSYYTFLAFLPTYFFLHKILSLTEVTTASVAANVATIIMTLIAGYLSDKFNRRSFLLIGICGVALSSSILFLSSNHSFPFYITMNIMYGGFIGMYYSCRSAFFAEAFPKSIRCTAVSMSVSVSQAFFGGLTPIITTWLASYSIHFIVVPMIIFSAVGVYALFQIKDRTGLPLLG